MAELKYSTSGTPYIETPEGRIIFSSSLKTRKGYKWFTYSHQFSDHVGIGNGRKVEISTRDSVAFDKDFQLPAKAFPIELKTKLKTIFNSLMDDQGYISFENVSLLEDILKNTDFEEIYNPKPKRKYKQRKA
jgi:hypothetical protein